MQKKNIEEEKITKLYLPSILKKSCPYINDSSVGQFPKSNFPGVKVLTEYRKQSGFIRVLQSLTKTEYQSNLVHFWVDCKSKYLPISLTFCFLPAINIFYSSKYCTHLKNIRDKINI